MPALQPLYGEPNMRDLFVADDVLEASAGLVARGAERLGEAARVVEVRPLEADAEHRDEGGCIGGARDALPEPVANRKATVGRAEGAQVGIVGGEVADLVERDAEEAAAEGGLAVDEEQERAAHELGGLELVVGEDVEELGAASGVAERLGPRRLGPLGDRDERGRPARRIEPATRGIALPHAGRRGGRELLPERGRENVVVRPSLDRPSRRLNHGATLPPPQPRCDPTAAATPVRASSRNRRATPVRPSSRGPPDGRQPPARQPANRGWVFPAFSSPGSRNGSCSARGMTQPRLILPGATHLVTRRTNLRHHLFAPDPQTRNIFLYCLAISARRTGVRVHVVVLMSTHPHLVLTDVEGRLPEFLHYLNRHVALAMKALRKWEGAFWDHEPTSVVELRTPQAVVERSAYSIVNTVEAGLVQNAKDWPGVTTRPSDIGTAVWTVERPEQFFRADDDKWPPTVELRLTMPPAAAQLGISDDEFRELVAAEVAEQERAARERVKERGDTFLGVDRCRKLSPFRRARSPEPVRDRNPTFAVGRGNREAFLESAARLRAFRLAYHQRLEAWRAGERTAPFPAGTWLMRHRHGAAVEEPVPAAA